MIGALALETNVRAVSYILSAVVWRCCNALLSGLSAPCTSATYKAVARCSCNIKRATRFLWAALASSRDDSVYLQTAVRWVLSEMCRLLQVNTFEQSASLARAHSRECIAHKVKFPQKSRAAELLAALEDILCPLREVST